MNETIVPQHFFEKSLKNLPFRVSFSWRKNNEKGTVGTNETWTSDIIGSMGISVAQSICCSKPLIKYIWNHKLVSVMTSMKEIIVKIPPHSLISF